MKDILLTDVCRPKQWKTISMQEMKSSGYPVFGANGIIGFYDKYTHEEPTLLITCRGATCGTMNISLPFSYVNGNAMALDNLDSENVDLKFLFYYLKNRTLRDTITGTAQPQITRESLKKVRILLPPLPKQKRIAEVLDKADALREKRRLALQKLDTLLQSVFLEMFGDPVRNPKGWDVRPLKELTNLITDGVHAKPNYTESGVPFISVKNITTGKLYFDSCKYVAEEDHKVFTKRCKAEFQDILYTKVGATYGRAVLVDTKKEFSLYVSVALIKPKHEIINASFLEAVMNSVGVKRQADKSIKGAGVPDLHLIEIKSFLVPVPSMEIQNEFVNKITFIKVIIEKQKQQLKNTEHLFQSLQQRAFKGELFSMEEQ